jgi:hypothetical protein
MRQIILFFFFFCTISSVFGQEDRDFRIKENRIQSIVRTTYTYDVNPKIKTKQGSFTLTFDPTGERIEAKRSNSKPSVYYQDEQGRDTLVEIFIENELKSKLIYRYGKDEVSNFQVIQKEGGWDTVGRQKQLYQNGIYVGIITFSATDTTSRLVISLKDNKPDTSAYWVKKNGQWQLNSYQVKSYNEHGFESKSVEYNGQGNLLSYTDYQTDPTGRLISFSQYDADGTQTFRRTSEFKNQGNYSKTIIERPGRPTQVNEFKIKYFKK